MSAVYLVETLTVYFFPLLLPGLISSSDRLFGVSSLSSFFELQYGSQFDSEVMILSGYLVRRDIGARQDNLLWMELKSLASVAETWFRSC